MAGAGRTLRQSRPTGGDRSRHLATLWPNTGPDKTCAPPCDPNHATVSKRPRGRGPRLQGLLLAGRVPRRLGPAPPREPHDTDTGRTHSRRVLARRRAIKHLRRYLEGADRAFKEQPRPRLEGAARGYDKKEEEDQHQKEGGEEEEAAYECPGNMHCPLALHRSRAKAHSEVRARAKAGEEANEDKILRLGPGPSGTNRDRQTATAIITALAGGRALLLHITSRHGDRVRVIDGRQRLVVLEQRRPRAPL